MQGICIDCQQEKEIIAKERCWACYQRKRRETYVPPLPNKEECSLCGKMKTVVIRLEDKQPVCVTCYKREFRPKEECSLCGKMRIVEMRNDGQPVCGTCYRREYRIKVASPV
ncbi:hypothetical protein IH779_03655 [Patescibacteria group bacterium]|nr:hypothetical protein [Patescibacteria group bacterium]